jgi:hypothetical protein
MRPNEDDLRGEIGASSGEAGEARSHRASQPGKLHQLEQAGSAAVGSAPCADEASEVSHKAGDDVRARALRQELAEPAPESKLGAVAPTKLSGESIPLARGVMNEASS